MFSGLGPYRLLELPLCPHTMICEEPDFKVYFDIVLMPRSVYNPMKQNI